ncbi:MAG: response regulator [Fibrobacterota bacterium]
MTTCIVSDDSALARAFIIKLLKMSGCENVNFIEAANGKEVLDLCRNVNPDYIFTDLTMPEMDGLTLIEKLKENTYPVKQIIVITSSGNKEARRNLDLLGITHILTKPVTHEQMKELVNHLSALPNTPQENSEYGY